jgi:hypothetical protein
MAISYFNDVVCHELKCRRPPEIMVSRLDYSVSVCDDIFFRLMVVIILFDVHTNFHEYISIVNILYIHKFTLIVKI